VTIRVENRFSRIALRETLAARLAIGIVFSAGVTSEMRGFVDECSTFGVGARGGCLPECTTKVNMTEIIGVDISICIRFSTGAIEEIARVGVPIEVSEVRSDCRMV